MTVWVVLSISNVPLHVFTSEDMANEFVQNNSGNLDCNFAGIHGCEFSA